MSGQLQHVGDDGPVRCSLCGADAVGPCATCSKPVCGDCCVLTEGGARVWAICLSCERRGGRAIGSRWWLVVGWVALPIGVLALAVAVLAWLSAR